LKENVFGGACGGRREDRTVTGWGEPGARDHLEDVSADERKTLKWILIKKGRKLLTGLSGLRTN
jgi:hypothetical protein